MEFIFALFFVCCLVFLVVGFVLGKFIEQEKLKTREKDIRKDSVMKSKSVIRGGLAEQLAPYFPDFPFSPSEAKFIGKPVDFIVFKGSDDKNITEVVFVEVKTGKSRLNQQEKNLKQSIESGKVSWFEYRLFDETKD